MDRKRRAAKRSVKSKNLQEYVKRKMTTDTVCHYLLYPVVHSTIGKSNDFYLHALRLMWNERNIFKDAQCRRLFQGLHTEKGEIETLAIENLARTKENGWFISSRKNDLAKIGKAAGYFLRHFASSVGKAFDEHFNPESSIGVKVMDDLFHVFQENKTITPAIVKLEISPNSNFDPSRFVCLPEEVVKILFNDEEIVLSRRAKLLAINTTFHDWAWRLLNSTAPETHNQIMDELFNNFILMETRSQPLHHVDQIDVLYPQIELIENPIDFLRGVNDNHQAEECCKVQLRPSSSRVKQQSSKYPSELFVI